jgi:hypothetical protein
MIMNLTGLTPKDILKLILESYIQVSKIDPLATVALRSHFLVEEEIDAVLAPVAKSPENLKLGRDPTFAKKVHCLRKISPLPDDKLWQPILKINALRNKVAHRFEGAERNKALQDLQQVLSASVSNRWFGLEPISTQRIVFTKWRGLQCYVWPILLVSPKIFEFKPSTDRQRGLLY